MKDPLAKISIDHFSFIPKYLQLADALSKGVEKGIFKRGTNLPSLHHCSVMLNVSKNTAEKAYNMLKKRGVVGAFKGKGYFIR